MCVCVCCTEEQVKKAKQKKEDFDFVNLRSMKRKSSFFNLTIHMHWNVIL